MSSDTTTTLTTEQWRTVLDDTDRPTFGEVVAAIEATDMIDADPEAVVERAVDAGVVVEDTDAGVFGELRIAPAGDPENQETAGDSTGEEPDPEDATPGFDTSKPASSTGEHTETDRNGLDAFADAVEFFHRHLDADLSSVDAVEYDTPRDYYREGRGWDADTVDDKLLGWAPASDTALLDHLMQRGHDREAIMATGLFWDGFEPVWKGRFVLPYVDAEGRPTFAISRRAGDGHPADRAGDYGDGPAKYHKLPVSTIDECTREEPIYGSDTVEAGEPVLITEGIADAITAHQAGYPCLSPVTTSFKIDDRERLADLLDAAGVPRAYIVNDAEPPTGSLRDADDAEGWDRLHVEQYGEGVRGAVRTAAYLAEQEVDARIGELPQPAAEKVDLDDYLIRWDGDLAPIMATARAVDDHPAHDPKAAALEAADASRSDTRTTATGRGSALYDLDIRDVTGLPWDYRGPNPLGHHGDSENYFVLDDGSGLGYDHKYKKACNALTYLLVDAGDRDAAAPNGPAGSLAVLLDV